MPSPKTIIKRKKQLRSWANLVGAKIPHGFAITGVMGGKARKLLASFQTSVGLDGTGKWSTATVRALDAASTKGGQLMALIRIHYAKRDQIHYSYPDHNDERMKCPKPPGVPSWTDCSGEARCLWWQAGWPDPAGAGYAVWGNSTYIINHTRNYGKFIPLGEERCGDIACYVGGVGHAEIVVSRGRVFTNGNELGPYFRDIAQHSGKLYICRLAPFV